MQIKKLKKKPLCKENVEKSTQECGVRETKNSANEPKGSRCDKPQKLVPVKPKKNLVNCKKSVKRKIFRRKEPLSTFQRYIVIHNQIFRKSHILYML